MRCPYCHKPIIGLTGLQEAQKFAVHLDKCRENTDNVLSDGARAVSLGKRYTLSDALKIRAESGQ